MHDDLSAPVPAVDESMWLYFACDCASRQAGSFAEPVAEPVAELVRELGWHVFERTGSAAPEPDAIVHADACIADVSCASDAVIVELQSARRAGRPILALQPAGVDPPFELGRVLAGYERSRVVTFTTSGECLARVQETFTDGTWLAMLRDAIPADDA
jgi:hypothetical protein